MRTHLEKLIKTIFFGKFNKNEKIHKKEKNSGKN